MRDSLISSTCGKEGMSGRWGMILRWSWTNNVKLLEITDASKTAYLCQIHILVTKDEFKDAR